MLGNQDGNTKSAVKTPIMIASMIKRKNWMLTDDSNSFSAGGIEFILSP
jgi:hypothetical protein